ncbi:pleckstrin homology domain-containing family A member 8 [Anoplophora glabripennis]|uniref:pleckstrin homology domain-containing family A member 8 n=1 Tax=Anoplophora glabripennis TaxID=217634 RepID=UPI0008738EEB|nr:pleckstrin homology domain-containing family A member 8 [Anoplophora glabripennis]
MSVANGAIPQEETKTIFSILPAQFPSVDGKIKTKEFLDAASGAVTLVDRFGKVFSPVTYDMNGNIRKLSQKYEEDTENNEYLEDMILKEQQGGQGLATDALMWLRRALHFLSSFFQRIVDDTNSERCSPDLTGFLKTAYSETLEEYHGWLGTQLFNVLSRFTPNRRHLIYTLALDRHNRDSNVINDMQNYNQKMIACVRYLTHFYKTNNLESYAAV